MSELMKDKEIFGIAAVVALTGLKAPCIRMWEKRYCAIQPERSPTNRRFYRRSDIERLQLLKCLTKSGHSISNLARLESSKLCSLAVDQGIPLPKNGVIPIEPRDTNRILIIGLGLASAMEAAGHHDFDILPVIKNLDEAYVMESLPQTDLLLIEAETIFPESKQMIEELIARTGAVRALVIFQFASRKEELSYSQTGHKISLIHAPVDAKRVRRECYLQLRAMQDESHQGLPLLIESIPSRMYDSQQLTAIQRIASDVKCDCPQHLADILLKLTAFEAYCIGCEDRNEHDALVHSYLHRVTAQVRRSMEQALMHLLKAEGITVE